MKYAFLFCAILFSISSTPLQARTINSFNDSQALMSIAQFMLDNAEDMPVSSRISDKKLKVNAPAECIDVLAGQVMKEVQSAIKGVLRLYPDEELPMEEAMEDLGSYLGNVPLKKCEYFKKDLNKVIHTSYFFDAANSIHVKVDTITLLVM